MVNVPCKGCHRRRSGCHSVCLEYQAYKINYEKEKNDIKQSKKKDKESLDYVINTINRLKPAKIN